METENNPVSDACYAKTFEAMRKDQQEAIKKLLDKSMWDDLKDMDDKLQTKHNWSGGLMESSSFIADIIPGRVYNGEAGMWTKGHLFKDLYAADKMMQRERDHEKNMETSRWYRFKYFCSEFPGMCKQKYLNWKSDLNRNGLKQQVRLLQCRCDYLEIKLKELKEVK